MPGCNWTGGWGRPHPAAIQSDLVIVCGGLVWLTPATACARAARAPAATAGGAAARPPGVSAPPADGAALGGRVPVAAAGKPSPFREGAGFGSGEWASKQTAIVCPVGHAGPPPGLAVAHFLPAGPFAIL